MKLRQAGAFVMTRQLPDFWAGGATALIFYVEYLGLGALLADALGPGLVDGAALGALLIVLPVFLSCMFSARTRGASLAGPRAASTALTTKLLLAMTLLSPVLVQQKTAVLALMTASAGITVLAGRHRWLQSRMDRAPRWLVQGFMFATAVGIISGGASAGRLLDCLLVDSAATWLAYLPAVALGIGWKPWVQALLRRLASQHAPQCLQRGCARLQQMGLPAASAISWLIYEQTPLAMPHGPFCGRFGNMRIESSLLFQRLQENFGQLHQLSLPTVGAAVLGGVLVGLVLLLESLTAFALNRGNPTYCKAQPGMLLATAASGLLSATIGAAASSFSTSRTVALRSLGGTGRTAVVAHGFTLVLIAFVAAPWLGQMPRLTGAVALTLVGVQMMSRDMAHFWRGAYQPRALYRRRLSGLSFWLVVGVGVAFNNALVGFLLMAVVCAAGIYLRSRWGSSNDASSRLSGLRAKKAGPRGDDRGPVESTK